MELGIRRREIRRRYGICDFSIDSFDRLIEKRNKNKAEIKSDIIWIGIYAGLFSIGVVGSKWIVGVIVGMGTSRVVKFIMRR